MLRNYKLLVIIKIVCFNFMLSYRLQFQYDIFVTFTDRFCGDPGEILIYTFNALFRVKLF